MYGSQFLAEIIILGLSQVSTQTPFLAKDVYQSQACHYTRSVYGLCKHMAVMALCMAVVERCPQNRGLLSTIVNGDAVVTKLGAREWPL